VPAGTGGYILAGYLLNQFFNEKGFKLLPAGNIFTGVFSLG
jgi:hypothetical protein